MESKLYIDSQGRAGYKKCPVWLRLRYLKEVNFQCQECHRQYLEKDLIPHRIKRGNKGGLYTVAPLGTKGSNVKILCGNHHKLVHCKEPGCRSR